MTVSRYPWQVNAWYFAEKRAGRLWDVACRDGVSCWLDWLPAWTYRHRKAAERRTRAKTHEGAPPTVR